MEGDFIKINHWLRPLSWLYGLGVGIRNALFDIGALKHTEYNTPVIAVGNITVGGTGKTPHVEYLVELLSGICRVAVLSRGYKRKSRGYVLATADSTVADIGDEPYQMKHKYPQLTVAVDRDRRNGISRLTTDDETKETDVILLDDAFQHRYVKPGINILLVDYHRLIVYDELLPAGRLREPLSGKNRADIVVITKCPADLKPMDYRVITKQIDLFPYQRLYFSTIDYRPLRRLTDREEMSLDALASSGSHVLLLTGIASPKQIIHDLAPHAATITPLTYADHHAFSPRDIEKMATAYRALPEPKIIITTEKDQTRLEAAGSLPADLAGNVWILPVRVRFMLGEQEAFDDNIKGYVLKNSRNSILAKAKDDDKTRDSHYPRHRSGTISFRNN